MRIHIIIILTNLQSQFEFRKYSEKIYLHFQAIDIFSGGYIRLTYRRTLSEFVCCNQLYVQMTTLRFATRLDQSLQNLNTVKALNFHLQNENFYKQIYQSFSKH